MCLRLELAGRAASRAALPQARSTAAGMVGQPGCPRAERARSSRSGNMRFERPPQALGCQCAAGPLGMTAGAAGDVAAGSNGGKAAGAAGSVIMGASVWGSAVADPNGVLQLRRHLTALEACPRRRGAAAQVSNVKRCLRAHQRRTIAGGGGQYGEGGRPAAHMRPGTNGSGGWRQRLPAASAGALQGPGPSGRSAGVQVIHASAPASCLATCTQGSQGLTCAPTLSPWRANRHNPPSRPVRQCEQAASL